MLDAKELLSQLGKLDEINCSKDIKSLTAAQFPGTHCPLMGAAMAVRGIKDAVLLVVGTDECAYYTKHMTLYSEEFGGMGGRCVSAVLDTRDVTFGCKAMLDDAVEELVNEYHPRAVFLVTTCVVEVIGDDTDSMAQNYTEKYNIPFLSVHTEHFKSENHLPGLERTITSCLQLMKPMPHDNRINVLGQRMGNFKDTELAHILMDSGVKLGMQLPCGCTIEEIEEAPAAKVNIVVNPIALPLAKKMQEIYQIPYIMFDKLTDPERIRTSYEKLFQYLNIPLPQKVEELYQQMKQKTEESTKELEGVSYIYGNTPFDCLEFNTFLSELGMVPKLVQTVSIEAERDKDYLSRILKHANPYVTKTANIAPLQPLYDELKPNLYLGHEFEERLNKKGIAMVHSDSASRMLGFEVTDFLLKELKRAAKQSKELRKEGSR